MTGTIKTLRTEKGFGFIKGDGGKEYFFHHTAIVGERMEDLREGDGVEFDLGHDAMDCEFRGDSTRIFHPIRNPLGQGDVGSFCGFLSWGGRYGFCRRLFFVFFAWAGFLRCGTFAARRIIAWNGLVQREGID